MSLVEKCWMVTSKISVIALLMITGIYFGKFVCPYIKKKKGAVAVSIVYITIMLVLYMIPPQIDNFSAYLIGVIAAFLAMYVEDRRNIYQKIFLAITFFSIRWLTVAMAGRLGSCYKSTCISEYECRKSVVAIRTICWNQSFGYCTLYCFYCGCNRTDQ